jgi:hypothetical protein
MKKTNLLKQCKFIASRLCLLLLIGVLSSCQQDEEIIALDEENMEMDLLADTSQDKMYHDVHGKDGKLIGTLNNKLEYVDETGKVVAKTLDSNHEVGAVFYRRTKFGGTKQGKYFTNQGDIYITNSDFTTNLRTELRGVVVGPNCSVELYAEDNFVNKTKTIDGGQNGAYKHNLGTTSRNPKSAIIRCTSRATRKRFTGFLFQREDFRGRAIPFFKGSTDFKPHRVKGFNTGISSISMNGAANDDKGVTITDIDNPTTELPIVLHNDIDANFLHRLNDRRLKISYQTVVLKNNQIGPALAAFERDNGGVKESVTRVQLTSLCEASVQYCWSYNANYEIGTGTGAGFCTLVFANVKAALTALPTVTGTAEIVAAMNGFTFTAATGGALGTALGTFIAANPIAATAATVAIGSCLYSYYLATKIPSLQDCRDLRNECMDSHYFNKTNCTDC